MQMIIGGRRVSRVRHACWAALCSAPLALSCSSLDPDLLHALTSGQGNGHSGPHGGHAGGGHSPHGPAATSCGGLITSDEVYRQVASDLARADAADRPFLRYVTLANDANARGCGAVLNLTRAALNKAINAVSLEPTLTPPVAIDAEETLYRLDLRDYAWDREIAIGGTSFGDAWEALIASTPYAVAHVGEDADDAAEASGTVVPVLFGNVFVTQVSSTPLYYELLGIPEDLDDFIAQDLGIDVNAARRDREVVRAGLGGSGVAAAELLAERFEMEVRAGYLWQVFYDIDGDQALIDDPLGTPDATERELLFTLPNGLLAHALAAADGTRIDVSDEIVDANEGDFRARVARSFMRLRPLGMEFTDEIRQVVLDNPGDYSPPEVDAVLDVYPEAQDLEALLLADRELVESALDNIGIDIEAAPEPVSQTATEFDRDVTLDVAAGDLYVSADDLRENLALLDPALGVLDGGSADRGDFSLLYTNSLCILSVVNENTVDPVLCE